MLTGLPNTMRLDVLLADFELDARVRRKECYVNDNGTAVMQLECGAFTEMLDERGVVYEQHLVLQEHLRASPALENVVVLPVKLLEIRESVDGGRRDGKAGGQVISGLTFKAIAGLTNSLLFFYPMLAFGGAESHDNYLCVGGQAIKSIARLEKNFFIPVTGPFAGSALRPKFCWLGDGAWRREAQGMISVRGSWPNENCTVTSNHHPNPNIAEPARSAQPVCVPRVLEDSLELEPEPAVDAPLQLEPAMAVSSQATGRPGHKLVLGAVSMGLAVKLVTVVYDAGRQLWKEVLTAHIEPYLRQHEDPQAPGLHVNDYPISVRLQKIVAWAVKKPPRARPDAVSCTPSQYSKETKKVKDKICELWKSARTGETEKRTERFVRTAERHVRGLLVELKIIGLPQQLQACMEQLMSAQTALSCQQAKTDTQHGVGLFETALRRQLPAGALKAVMLATSVLQEAKRIKAEHAKARCDAAYTFFTTSQDGDVQWGPRVTAPYGEDVDGTTLLALGNAELFGAARKLANCTKSEGVSRAGTLGFTSLYGLVNDDVKKDLVTAALGVRGTIVYPRPMMLGILHLFCIRGFGTMFSLTGCLAHELCIGARLTTDLKKHGVPAHFVLIHEQLKFKCLKFRGYDALKCFEDPENWLMGFPEPYRGLLALAFRFLGSMWYIVSNPMLEQSFFQDLPCSERREHAGVILQRLAMALDTILRRLFGKLPFTPSMHSVIHDIVRDFGAGVDTYFGNEQAIEAAQQLARELLRHIKSREEKDGVHARMIKDWVVWMEVQLSARDAKARQTAAVERQLKRWRTTRRAHVLNSVDLLVAWERSQLQMVRASTACDDDACESLQTLLEDDVGLKKTAVGGVGGDTVNRSRGGPRLKMCGAGLVVVPDPPPPDRAPMLQDRPSKRTRRGEDTTDLVDNEGDESENGDMSELVRLGDTAGLAALQDEIHQQLAAALGGSEEGEDEEEEDEDEEDGVVEEEEAVMPYDAEIFWEQYTYWASVNSGYQRAGPAPEAVHNIVAYTLRGIPRLGVVKLELDQRATVTEPKNRIIPVIPLELDGAQAAAGRLRESCQGTSSIHVRLIKAGMVADHTEGRRKHWLVSLIDQASLLSAC